MIRETAVKFGEGGRLIGILTEPTARSPRAVFVLVTVAFNPKFGLYRIYAEWARTLAAAGIATLRFDIGGIGETVALRTGTLQSRTLAEIGDAVTFVDRSLPGLPLFLGGICSGAEDALRYAEGDARVTRVVLVDPFAYRTSGWGWRHDLFRVRRRLLRLLRVSRPSNTAWTPGIISYNHMTLEVSSRVVGQLASRGVVMHFIYTSGRRELFNHASQLPKMFPELALADVTTADFIPHLEHAQILGEDRRTLMATILRRLSAPVRPATPHPR